MDSNEKDRKQNSGQKRKQSARQRNPNLRLVKNGDSPVKNEKQSAGEAKKTVRGKKKETEEAKKTSQEGKKAAEEAKKTAREEKKEAEETKQTSPKEKKKPEGRKKSGQESRKEPEEIKKSARKGKKKRKTTKSSKEESSVGESSFGGGKEAGKAKNPAKEEKKDPEGTGKPSKEEKGSKEAKEPAEKKKKKARGKTKQEGEKKKNEGKEKPEGKRKKTEGKEKPEEEKKKTGGKEKPEEEKKKTGGKEKPEGEKKKPEKKTGKKSRKPDVRRRDRAVYQNRPGLGEWFVQNKSLVIIGFTIFACCALLTGIYYYISTAYEVTTVYVDGNVHYTNEEVMDMVMEGRYGKNSLYLAMKYKDKGIEGIPFVEKMDVNILTPNTIRISVYEKALAGYVEYLGRYMYFDRDGTVVESSAERTRGIPQVTGLKFDYVVVNEPLPVENDEIFKRILDITQLLNKYELTADKIFFDSSYDLTLFFGNIRVTLGSSSEIDQKIIRLRNILPELEGKSGMLQMENYTEDTKNITFHQE